MYKTLLITATIFASTSINCASSSQSHLSQRKSTPSKPEIGSPEELQQVIAAREEVRKKYLDRNEDLQIEAYELAEEGIDYTKEASDPCLIKLHRHMDRVTPAHLKRLFNNRLVELAPPFVRIHEQMKDPLHRIKHECNHDCNKEKAVSRNYRGAMGSFILGCLPLWEHAYNNPHEVLQSWTHNFPETCWIYSLAGLGIAGCICFCRDGSQAASEGRLEREICRNGALNDVAPKSLIMDIE